MKTEEMTYLPPLTFTPVLKQTVWGGAHIARQRGLDAERYGHIGESWELSGLPGDESPVAGGPFDGRTLSSLMAERGEQLVGRACLDRWGTRFPVLVKFIDSARDLSVQVHPADAQAVREGKRGKNEMWYVVSADEGARLLCGWSREVTPDSFRRMIETDGVLDAVGTWPVKPGDLFYLPAGRIHALGGGMRVIEIQDASDVTYRVYDYGRLGLDGRPRELHVAQAMEALDFAPTGDCRTRYTLEPGRPQPVVRAPHFTTSLLELAAPYVADLAGRDTFVLVTCAAGRVALSDAHGFRAELGVAATALLPATTECVSLEPLAAGTRVLLTTPATPLA